MPQGLDDIRALQEAGYSDSEIQSYMGEERALLQEGGFSERETDEYFGIPQFDPQPLEKHFESSFTQLVDSWKRPLNSSQEGAPLAADPTAAPPAADGGKQPPPKQADSFMEALEAGLQMSVSGLLARGQMPGVVVGDEQDWYMRIGNQLGMTMGDLPPMLAAGMATSAALGPAAPVAAPVTTAALVGFTGNALPTAMREILVSKYQKGEVTDFKDFWTRASAVFMKTLKSGVVGAATLGVGKGVGGAVSQPMLRTTAQMASEIGTMVSVGKALEGEVPKPSDFADAAIVIAGLSGATKMTGRLYSIYAKTGMSPSAVAEQAVNDPIVRQQIIGDGINIPGAYEPFVDPAAPKTVESVKLDKSFDDGKYQTSKSSPLDTTADITKNFLADEAGSAGAPPVTPPEVVRTEAEKAVLSRIGEVPGKKAELNWDKAYTAAVDKFHPIAEFRDVVTKGEPVPAGRDPYTLTRLTRGNTGRATVWIEFQPYDYRTFKDVEGSKGLKQIFEPVAADLDGWRAYAMAKRAVTKEAQGIATGIDVEAAKTVVKDGAAKYEGVLREVVQYRRNLLNYMRDSGILTEQQIQGWERSDPDYAAPFYRIFEEGQGGTGAGRGLTVKQPIKQMKGSERQIVDPVESLIRDTYTFVDLAERNRVLRSVVELGEAYVVPPELMEKVQAPLKPIDVSPEEIARFNEEFGMDGEVAQQAMTIFRPMKQPLAADEIAVFREGKRQVYRVPPELAAALKDMDVPMANKLMTIISGPVKTLKAGTVILPEFAAKNFMRDQLSAFVFSKNGYIPVLDFMKGLAEQYRRGETYKQWLKGGGAGSSFVAMDRNYINEKVMRIEPFVSVQDKVWNLVKSPRHAAQAFGEMVENATRIGEMKRAMQGKNPTRTNTMAAAFESREVTLDFARIGARMQALNQAIAFQNPQIQGLDRTVRAFKDNPMGTMIKAGVIAAVSATLWEANRNDPRIDEIPRWQKDLFWLIPVDNWERVSAKEAAMAGKFAKQGPDGSWRINKGSIWRVPKPQELGLMFGSMTERMLEAVVDQDKRAFKDFGGTAFDLITPGLMPNIAVPFLETLNNRSTFTGAPVVPAHLERLLPEAQYTEYTTESAKQLGKLVPSVPFGELNLSSPMVIENWVRAWSGGLGMYALNIADQALFAAGVVAKPPKPDAALADIPVIKAFVARFPSANAVSIVDFKQRYAENQQYINTLKHYASRGDLDAYKRLALAQENSGKFQSLASTEKALSNLKRSIELTHLNPKLKPDEKRQLIDGMYMGMIQAAQFGNQLVDEIDKIVKKK